MKKIIFSILFVASALNFTHCEPAHGTGRTTSSGYFQTDFQDESQFIVENITADLAEQIYYAKFHHPPEAKNFFISATETPDSSFGAPTYELEIDLDVNHRGIKNKLNINGPIWSPEVYEALATQLAKAIELPASENNSTPNTTLLASLTDGAATTIEDENQKLSQSLGSNFSKASLHEEAAILLGAFTLREHSGNFFEIRSPLCRITAHLTMARYLSGGNLSAINGQMAEAMLLTLMNNQTAALDKLSDIKTNVTAVTSWVRALQARNTGDYRPLEKLGGLSQVECINWFYALDHSANTDIAWNKLSDVQKQTADFVRIANEGNYSVGVGHELLAVALRAEFSEIAAVYQSSHQKVLKKDGLPEALNEMPERCFSVDSDGKSVVRVIGWGLWAGFLQRQLCHAVQHNFDFMQWRWGVPEDAHAFSTNIDQTLNGLRLYPFVRRFNCVDVASYHQSVDDGFKVTVATPQLVPAECWNYLCYEFSDTERYQPNPNPHVNEWHKHNPPPGTVYDINPRLNHPSLIGRSDSAAMLDKLHEQAPYDSQIVNYIFKHKYGTIQPTYEQAADLYQPVLAYASYAMQTVAKTVRNQPERYEQLLSKAAVLDPKNYIVLGNYFAALTQDDKAAAYYEKANALDPDSVRTSYDASWLVNYYLKHNQKEKARAVADAAGEVYSSGGLRAKAEFFEATGDYQNAFQWYSNMEERCNESGAVITFCLRYKTKTHGTQFDGELQKRFGKLFPRGLEKVKVADFQSPPKDGVVFKGENDLLRAAGLKMGDVIVAVYGIRIYDSFQYDYGRSSTTAPELDLIVWDSRDRHYHEIKASPPNHLFGVDIDTYSPK